MSSTDTTNVQFQDNEGNTRPGSVQATLYETRDRILRAAVRLVGFWAAAVLSAFIPLAHFVLVPAFLIAGIVMAISAYRTDRALNQAQGECPVCQEQITIPLEANDQLPKWTYCPACNAPLQVVVTDTGKSG